MIKIIDDFGGITTYKISRAITVVINNTLSSQLMNQVLSNSPISILKKMAGGNFQQIMQTVNQMSAMLNEMSSTSKIKHFLNKIQ